MTDISGRSDREFRKWLISRLKADEALEPHDKLYVPLYDGVEGDPVDLLFDDIELSEVESLNFISGFRGSGKTTELFRLRKRLEDQGYFVAYANALDYLLPAEPVDISDFLLVLAGSFSEAIEEKLDIDLAHEGFWTRFVNFLGRTKVKIEGFDFKTGVPGTDVGLNVKTSLKDEPSFRKLLRQKLAARLGELRNEVYDFFDFGRKRIREVKGDCGVVFIFDQFEQLRDTHDTQGRVSESVTTLIANHTADLRVRSLHMIFTLPPWLKFRLPALRGIRLLYNIKLWNNNEKRTPTKPGWEIMREIVLRRFTDEGMTRFFGKPTSSGKYKLANELIAASGGHFRDLIWLLRETVLRANDLPCKSGQVTAAINNLRDSYFPLSLADARLLNQIEQQRDCVLDDSALDEIQRVTLFLDTHAALILRNGDEWYDIHPLIREQVLEILRREEKANGQEAMSSKPATELSTDAIAHLYRWDEIEGWRLMLEHFDLTEGFALIVVLAPDEWGVALARGQLANALGSADAVVRVCFDPAEGTDSLAEELLALSEQPPQVKCVWIDSDPADPDHLQQRQKDWRKALAKLNRSRNTLQARFSCTLAIALPSRFQKTLVESAPDIWSIRSGVFRVEPPGGSRTAIAQLPAEEWNVLVDQQKLDSGDPAETLAQVEKLRGKPGREVLLARLLQRAGNQARTRLNWTLAEDCLTEAYKLEKAIGWGDPELHWEIANDLAKVFYDMARFDRAKHYCKLALEIAEQRFSPDHPKTAISLNNLAMLLKATNRLAEAEPLMRRALAIDEQSYGDQHPNVAVQLNNLAGLLAATNCLAEAEPLMRRALAIDEQSYGDQHPRVAIRLNNLAQLLKATNRLAEAEPLMRRALAIDEQSYGDQHPRVAVQLNNLATLLQATNRLAEAEPLMRRALAIDEQSYGAEHPKVAIRLNNLAQLLQDTNRLAEAESLLRRAFNIFQVSYGDEHPQTRIVGKNLAALLQKIETGEEG